MITLYSKKYYFKQNTRIFFFLKEENKERNRKKKNVSYEIRHNVFTTALMLLSIVL